MNESHKHYLTIEKAIRYIRENATQQPSLAEIAKAVQMSEYHLQRVFAAWAGISPKRFLQFTTKEHALTLLRDSDNLIETALEVGLSGTGRLHDLMVSCEAMTPGEVKQLGRDLEIRYGEALTPFGSALFAWTARGICALEFVDASYISMVDRLKSQWQYARFVEAPKEAATISAQVFAAVTPTQPITLLIKGTNFQLKVWQALLQSKPSQLLSYSQLASLCGSPKAQRAVGSALASNPIGYLIPCHRVIKGDGDVNQYRWGSDRKVAIHGWEAASSYP